jgi:hypothetical protein
VCVCNERGAGVIVGKVAETRHSVELADARKSGTMGFQALRTSKKQLIPIDLLRRENYATLDV